MIAAAVALAALRERNAGGRPCASLACPWWAYEVEGDPHATPPRGRRFRRRRRRRSAQPVPLAPPPSPVGGFGVPYAAERFGVSARTLRRLLAIQPPPLSIGAAKYLHARWPDDHSFRLWLATAQQKRRRPMKSAKGAESGEPASARKPSSAVRVARSVPLRGGAAESDPDFTQTVRDLVGGGRSRGQMRGKR